MATQWRMKRQFSSNAAPVRANHFVSRSFNDLPFLDEKLLKGVTEASYTTAEFPWKWVRSARQYLYVPGFVDNYSFLRKPIGCMIIFRRKYCSSIIHDLCILSYAFVRPVPSPNNGASDDTKMVQDELDITFLRKYKMSRQELEVPWAQPCGAGIHWFFPVGYLTWRI